MKKIRKPKTERVSSLKLSKNVPSSLTPLFNALDKVSSLCNKINVLSDNISSLIFHQNLGVLDNRRLVDESLLTKTSSYINLGVFELPISIRTSLESMQRFSGMNDNYSIVSNYEHSSIENFSIIGNQHGNIHSWSNYLYSGINSPIYGIDGIKLVSESLSLNTYGNSTFNIDGICANLRDLGLSAHFKSTYNVMENVGLANDAFSYVDSFKNPAFTTPNLTKVYPSVLSENVVLEAHNLLPNITSFKLPKDDWPINIYNSAYSVFNADGIRTNLEDLGVPSLFKATCNGIENVGLVNDAFSYLDSFKNPALVYSSQTKVHSSFLSESLISAAYNPLSNIVSSNWAKNNWPINIYDSVYSGGDTDRICANLGDLGVSTSFKVACNAMENISLLNTGFSYLDDFRSPTFESLSLETLYTTRSVDNLTLNPTTKNTSLKIKQSPLRAVEIAKKFVESVEMHLEDSSVSHETRKIEYSVDGNNINVNLTINITNINVKQAKGKVVQIGKENHYNEFKN